MRIAFVGLGSIAKRHLSNVHNYLASHSIECEIDVYRSGFGNPLPEELTGIVSHQYSLGVVKEEYDVVFITNPTSLHYDALKSFQYHGKAFFIEKPVFGSTDVNMDCLKGLKDKVCYVACPLRYNPVIEYVKTSIDLQKVISARAISSSYLPEWRPETDYRDCYSAHANLGGGVDIDLIHEWDYLLFLFGMVRSGFAIRNKVSNLEIDSNDIAVYIAQNENCILELHLDYFGRKALRTLTLFTNEETIECDILSGTVSYLNTGNTIMFSNERNEYQSREIEHFFDIVSGNIANDSTIEHALQVLRYAKGDFN